MDAGTEGSHCIAGSKPGGLRAWRVRAEPPDSEFDPYRILVKWTGHSWPFTIITLQRDCFAFCFFLWHENFICQDMR